jgi:hypothetical protein
MNCKSQFVVYALVCNACGELYVGQTSSPLSIRANQHRSNANASDIFGLKVSRHLHTCAAGCDIKFKIMPIVQPSIRTTAALLYWEDFIIKRLSPSLNV